MEPPNFRFQRNERLKGRNDIRAVFGRGRRFGCRGVKLFALKNGLDYNRICFTFSRGFGNAVERNRARRLGREVYRQMRPRLRGGYDFVLQVFPDTRQAFDVRTDQLEFLFSKAGLFK